MKKNKIINLIDYKNKRDIEIKTNNKSYEEIVSETYAQQLTNDFEDLLKKNRDLSNKKRGE